MEHFPRRNCIKWHTLFLTLLSDASTPLIIGQVYLVYRSITLTLILSRQGTVESTCLHIFLIKREQSQKLYNHPCPSGIELEGGEIHTPFFWQILDELHSLPLPCWSRSPAEVIRRAGHGIGNSACTTSLSLIGVESWLAMRFLTGAKYRR